jgi:hypothetical protein
VWQKKAEAMAQRLEFYRKQARVLDDGAELTAARLTEEVDSVRAELGQAQAAHESHLTALRTELDAARGTLAETETKLKHAQYLLKRQQDTPWLSRRAWALLCVVLATFMWMHFSYLRPSPLERRCHNTITALKHHHNERIRSLQQAQPLFDASDTSNARLRKENEWLRQQWKGALNARTEMEIELAYAWIVDDGLEVREVVQSGESLSFGQVLVNACEVNDLCIPYSLHVTRDGSIHVVSGRPSADYLTSQIIWKAQPSVPLTSRNGRGVHLHLTPNGVLVLRDSATRDTYWSSTDHNLPRGQYSLRIGRSGALEIMVGDKAVWSSADGETRRGSVAASFF